MGSYNASTGTWTKGADYSLTETNRNTYRVTGEIPYGEADAIFPTAGNRFAVRIANKNITSKSQLPSGTICKTTNKEVASGYNTATKAAFEDDGSLIAIFAPTAATKDAYNREVKIEWEGDGVFVTYTFNLTNATLESEPSPQPTGLTPFAGGDTVTSIVINPNGLTNQEMNAWIANLPKETDPENLGYESLDIELLSDSNDDAMIKVQGDNENGYYIEVGVTDHNPNILWFDETSCQQIGQNEAGWYTSPLGGETWTKLEQETTYECKEEQGATYVAVTYTIGQNGVSEYFSVLNGYVIGNATA